MNDTARILVVDDDLEILSLVEGVLQRNGMEARTASSTTEADEILSEFDVDLLVLDLMMQGEDGLSYCRRIRHHSAIPIIMLTAIAEDVDRIVGLEVGADDYLAKPFNPRELIARIKSVMRRTQVSTTETKQSVNKSIYTFGAFRLLPDQMSLQNENGEPIHVTSGEFTLLLALVERAPRVLSRDQLLDISRGVVANPFDRSIDSQISRLRGKLETNPKHPEYIKTVRNLGYAFAMKVRQVKQ